MQASSTHTTGLFSQVGNSCSSSQCLSCCTAHGLTNTFGAVQANVTRQCTGPATAHMHLPGPQAIAWPTSNCWVPEKG
jgi:hypothetical protein